MAASKNIVLVFKNAKSKSEFPSKLFVQNALKASRDYVAANMRDVDYYVAIGFDDARAVYVQLLSTEQKIGKALAKGTAQSTMLRFLRGFQFGYGGERLSSTTSVAQIKNIGGYMLAMAQDLKQ
jgi:hypothetical protein